jgi:hypothetical protein
MFRDSDRAMTADQLRDTTAAGIARPFLRFVQSALKLDTASDCAQHVLGGLASVPRIAREAEAFFKCEAGGEVRGLSAKGIMASTTGSRHSCASHGICTSNTLV